MAHIRQSRPDSGFDLSHFDFCFESLFSSSLQMEPASKGPASAGPHRSQLEHNYSTEMCSSSDAGFFFKLIDFVHHTTLGSRVKQKTKRKRGRDDAPQRTLHTQSTGVFRSQETTASSHPTAVIKKKKKGAHHLAADRHDDQIFGHAEGVVRVPIGSRLPNLSYGSGLRV